MQDSSGILSILAAGFGVAVLHASLPTHWLPFVAVARANHWSKGKTIAVTAIASIGHTLSTLALGSLIVAFGIKFHEGAERYYHFISGGILLSFGIFYLFRSKKAHHHGEGCSHGLRHVTAEPVNKLSDRAAIVSLILILTTSPCEAFLPIYLSGVSFGWWGFLVLSFTLVTATLVGMVSLTMLAFAGWTKVGFSKIEKHEQKIVAILLIVVGILTLATRH